MNYYSGLDNKDEEKYLIINKILNMVRKAAGKPFVKIEK